MSLAKRYDPKEAEPRLLAFWQAAKIYHFDPGASGPVYSIDTPPSSVSGKLHLGHVYSYSHPDFMARFFRMNGFRVFYPMGYDDNGLPTDRLVEKQLGLSARQIGRPAYIEKCLQVSEQAEREYEALWKRLGLSVDWRDTYRTIDDRSRRISQLSFIRQYRSGRAYRREAPAIWCPECKTTIAQAELNDLERQSEGEAGLLLERQPTSQILRVHERCDTPVEYTMNWQWFIRILDEKERLLEAGEAVQWRPPHMKARYRAWVENLNRDWCISRQRYFGVPFPVWYCRDCGEAILAEEDQLPVDPSEQSPPHSCSCGSEDFIPETDILDTWATSSLSPQIAGQWLERPEQFEQVFPFSLRPQGHEIIRTWAFYTIVKSLFHFDAIPWKEVLISGWGIAAEGQDKISKSRGGGPMPPMEMIAGYSADAVRYWTSGSGPGKNAVISEQKIQAGFRLVTKLWNVARFSERFLEGYLPPAQPPALTPADRWILARLQRLIRRATRLFNDDEYAAVKSEIESFFWRDLTDNYLEMCKQRLYLPSSPEHEGARYTLYHVLLVLIKLFAPFLPFVTEEIYQGLFLGKETGLDAGDAPVSIHTSRWPKPDSAFEDEAAEKMGEVLVEIATSVRRYKSEHNLPLSSELHRLQLTVSETGAAAVLREAQADLNSITRARRIEILERSGGALEANDRPFIRIFGDDNVEQYASQSL